MRQGSVYSRSQKNQAKISKKLRFFSCSKKHAPNGACVVSKQILPFSQKLHHSEDHRWDLFPRCWIFSSRSVSDSDFHHFQSFRSQIRLFEIQTFLILLKRGKLVIPEVVSNISLSSRCDVFMSDYSIRSDRILFHQIFYEFFDRFSLLISECMTIAHNLNPYWVEIQIFFLFICWFSCVPCAFPRICELIHGSIGINYKMTRNLSWRVCEILDYINPSSLACMMEYHIFAGIEQRWKVFRGLVVFIQFHLLFRKELKVFWDRSLDRSP